MSEHWREIARRFKDPYDYRAPALKFERRTGLIGINAPWRMPNNRPHAEIECEIFEEIFVLRETAERWYERTDRVAHRRVLAFLESALLLNPELRGLRRFFGNIEMLPDIVMGITSQFPVADIVYFLLIPTKEYNSNPALTSAIAATEMRAGAQMFWKPSPRTLARIGRLMDRNPRYRTGAYARCA